MATAAPAVAEEEWRGRRRKKRQNKKQKNTWSKNPHKELDLHTQKHTHIAFFAASKKFSFMRFCRAVFLCWFCSFLFLFEKQHHFSLSLSYSISIVYYLNSKSFAFSTFCSHFVPNKMHLITICISFLPSSTEKKHKNKMNEHKTTVSGELTITTKMTKIIFWFFPYHIVVKTTCIYVYEFMNILFKTDFFLFLFYWWSGLFKTSKQRLMNSKSTKNHIKNV